MSFFRCNNPATTLPSWFYYKDITLIVDTQDMTIQFDNTKTVLALDIICLNGSAMRSNSNTGAYAHKRVREDNYMWNMSQLNGSSPPVENSTTSNVTLSVDYTTGVITATATSARPWRGGHTFRAIIIYA